MKTEIDADLRFFTHIEMKGDDTMHTMSNLKDRAFVLDSKKVQDFLSQKINTSTDALKRASERNMRNNKTLAEKRI